MNTHATEVAVRHNAAENRFEAEVEGRLSVADYQLRGTEMIMTHTFVPPALRGRGIAEKLVRFALEHARTERLRVVPACSYVETFMRRHKEFAPLLKPLD
jgi:predicted GNAT family acetyltransferase